MQEGRVISLNVGELVATLTLDDSRFTRPLQQAEQQANRSAKDIDAAILGAATGTDKLGRSAKDTGRDLGNVGRSAKDMDKVGQSAKRSADEVGKIGQAAQGAASKLSGLAGQASGQAGAGAGGNFLAGFSSKIGDLGGKGGPIAASLVGVAAVGLAAGAVLMKTIADGMRREAAMDVVQAKLGVDEATMQRIGTAAGRAFNNAWGDSVEGNMESLTAAFDFKLLDSTATTTEMENVIEKVETLNTLLDTETSDSLRGVSGLVNSGLVKDFDQAADFIATARKIGMNAQGDLIDSLSEYSTGWKNTGLTAETTLALINQSMGPGFGADNTDRASDALREFGRRMSEESDTIVEAIDQIGLSGQDMFAQLKKGGPEADAAFDQVMDGLRGIDDQQERNRIAAKLLGDTSGDFYAALANWDPSEAVKKFGDVEGAAKRAGDTLGGGTLAKVQGSINTIKTSADDLKLAMAGAFAPGLEDLATGIAQHKPEIMAFFTELADAGFVTLDAIIGFTSGTLRALAGLTGGSSVALGGMIEGLGTLAGGLAKVMSIIPGMQDDADVFEGVASALDNFREKGIGAADSLRGMADTIDAGRPKLQAMRDDVRSAGEAAQNSEILMRALGDAVVTGIPDEKSILISDNSPETVARLEALGLKVETTPNGIRVTAKTDEADTIIGDFINKERTVVVNVRTVGIPSGDVVTGAAPAPGVSGQASNPMLPYGGARPQADGSIMAGSFADGKLPDEALIQSPRAHYIQWAEPETGGEAFIPLSVSKRHRSEHIQQEVATKFGFDLVKMADGGVFDAAAAVNRAKSKNGEAYVYGTNDCSSYLSEVFNAGTGQSVRFTTDSDFASMGWVPGYDPDGFSIGTNGGSGENGHMGGDLYGVPIENDGSNGVQYGGSANGATSFPQVWHWPGASGGGKLSTEQLAQADRMVEDALSAELNATGPSKADATKRRQMLEQQRDKLKVGGASGRTDSGISMSTDGQRVYVTNWPTSLGGDKGDEREPRLTAGLKVFANGGEDHTAQIAGAGAMRLWAEPETGGEAYIPLGANKRPRSLALTKQVANRFGYTLVPMAEGGIGFGGYSGPDTEDPMAPKNWYQGVALASGIGFTALSALGPYLSMAQSKQVDLSNLTPQFDTSANTIPGLDGAFKEVTGLLEQIAEAAQQGKPVNLQVTVDSQSGGVDVEFMRRGL